MHFNLNQMVYKSIGLMSGSSLDGLDIVFAHFQEVAGKWNYEVKAADCHPYPDEWRKRLENAERLSALDYCLLHTEFGHYLGQQVNLFTERNNIHLQADIIASHGHTVFHLPGKRLTTQLGDGAAIAAETNMAVVSDLRALDVALGGQGAPIVPLGEKLLFPDTELFLNIGGIANISYHIPDHVAAFDICPANRVLNMLASELGKTFDENGALAKMGQIHDPLLQELNNQGFYKKSWPKSLANEFGAKEIFSIIQKYPLSVQGKLRTFTEHISIQIRNAVECILRMGKSQSHTHSLFITGGGAFNNYLIELIKEKLLGLFVTTIVPDAGTVKFKEALIMALLGVLRWRENNTTLATVTGAGRDSIGGALWMGQEA